MFLAALGTYEASFKRPSLYLILSREAVLLGGVGGFEGKYIRVKMNTAPAIPQSEKKFHYLLTTY